MRTMVRCCSNHKRCALNLRFVVSVLVLFLGIITGSATSNDDQKATCEADGTCIPDASTTTTTTEASSSKEEGNISTNCQDADSEANCSLWAGLGECEKNPTYMLLKCQKSCGVCNGGRKAQQQVTSTKSIDDIPSSPENGWGVEQDVLGTPLQMMATQAVVEQTKEYMLKKVFVSPKYATVKEKCKNLETMCSLWASSGECIDNAIFMQVNCAPACQTCEMVDFSTRCPFDPTKVGDDNVWNANLGLNEMFQRIVTDPAYQTLEPKVQRRPASITTAYADADDVPDGPWIVTFDNFLTPDECETLWQLGQIRGYSVAANIAGSQRFDGTYDSHVTTMRSDSVQVAWCLDDCDRHAVSQSIVSKITNLTGIPSNNLDYLQVRQYPASKFLHESHDFAKEHVLRAQGPRILTLFVFLTDDTTSTGGSIPGAGGGQVRFPKLKHLTIEPKRGRAVLWPNVLDSDPNQYDARTIYQNLPVTEGVQFGLTAWIHLRDFKTPYEANCI